MTITFPFSAVVLAADRTNNDPVAQAAGVPCKALSPVAGIPMVLRVIAALEASTEVQSVLLCGPPEPVLMASAELREGISADRFSWLPNQTSLSASAYHAMMTLAPEAPVLLTTADHALLTPRVVDYFCANARDNGYDAVIALAPYAQVEAAYPGIRRTVLRFQDNAYCGCNLYAFLTPRSRLLADFWRRVESQRKKPWRIIRLLGWTAVLRYLLGRLSLGASLEQLSTRLELRLGAVILPFPEAAVDVDSVDDWRFVERAAADKG